MKIETGYYKCRNGSKARVLCADAPGKYPAIGYLVFDGEADVKTWDLTGQHCTEPEKCRHDIVEPWRDEPEPEQTVTLPLSKLRELLIQASEDVGEDEPLTKEEADDWLVEEGILPAPAKQPVRVSGWVNVYKDRRSSVHNSKELADKQTVASERIACVYVTGTEGVGPASSDERGGEG